VGRLRDGLLEVRLAAPPVDGAANAELVETLATALGLPRRAVTLVAGEHARIKRLRIEGLAEEEVLARLGLRRDAAEGRAADAVSATRRVRPGS
jgi:uncharacterized protein YggU (UPF0235/DUF167 family)